MGSCQEPLVASPTIALLKTSPPALLRNCNGQTKYIAMDPKGPDTGRTGSGMLQLELVQAAEWRDFEIRMN